jgi:hypothetical protein
MVLLSFPFPCQQIRLIFVLLATCSSHAYSCAQDLLVRALTGMDHQIHDRCLGDLLTLRGCSYFLCCGLFNFSGTFFSFRGCPMLISCALHCSRGCVRIAKGLCKHVQCPFWQFLLFTLFQCHSLHFSYYIYLSSCFYCTSSYIGSLLLL